ncbi:hypothetical protein [Phosphitispora sp. TUW77]|uniref:hypothetical protein n=1 Tax=Phosphitispora sp. TUW77 TaxID=3152361 RepID=UPI003AB7F394
MRKKNRILALLIFTFLMFGLMGCGSVEDKAAEKAAEKIVENATGAEVDINEDGVTVDSEDSSLQTGQQLDWPEDDMGDLPEPKATITGVITVAQGACTVSFSKMTVNDAKEYMAELTKMGFKNGMNIADQESLALTGARDDGSSVTFAYNIPEQEGTITYGKITQ